MIPGTVPMMPISYSKSVWGNQARVFGGDTGSGTTADIQAFDISVLGNSSYFSTLAFSRQRLASASDGLTAVAAGGYLNTTSAIESIRIRTQADAVSFGNLSTNSYTMGAVSSEDRGVFASIGTSYSSLIEYITFDTPSNSSTFSYLLQSITGPGGLSNGVRGIFFGGNNSQVSLSAIQYITIAVESYAAFFGSMTVKRGGVVAGMSSESDIGLMGPGYIGQGSYTYNMDYINISTFSNATFFGNMSTSRVGYSAVTNGSRGVFVGGNVSASNRLQYVDIDTTSNTSDFGDLTSNLYYATATQGT